MNTLQATITNVTVSNQLSALKVAVSEDTFHLLLAEASHDTIGQIVTLVFKETEIVLAKQKCETTTNIAHATIEEIKRGAVLSQVILNYHSHTISALVATSTLENLQLSPQESVFWMIQPSEISLLRGYKHEV